MIFCMLVPLFGTIRAYLCIKSNNRIAMRNTDFTIENLASMISSESSLSALVEMIGEMGLEITEIALAAK